MEIRTVDVTEADAVSARLFFDVVKGFYPIHSVIALDMFARNGQLTVPNYVGSVCNFDLWELSPEHYDALEKFHPREIRIGCSYASMKHAIAEDRQYGMIVIDTPQGVHQDSEGREHYEHFDVLREFPAMLEDRALVVLYVNQRPYDKNEVGEHGYDTYDGYDFQKWMEARKAFFRAPNPSSLSVSDALNAYVRHFSEVGFDTVTQVVVPCFSDVAGRESYAFRLGLEVVRR